MTAIVLALAVLQEPDLESAIASLNAEDPAVREEAQRRLDAAVRDLGERARETLQRHVDHPSPEMRTRIARLLAHLDAVVACRKKLALFDRLELPDVAGKPRVHFNSGGWMIWGDDEFEFHYQFGWVLRRTDDALTLLEDDLATRTYAINVALPDRWDEFKDRHPADRPLPGKCVEIDFTASARRLLETGAEEDIGGFEPALYAYWALQRNESDLALGLLAVAEKQAASEERTFEQFLLGEVAGNLRYRAIAGGHAGVDRRDVVALWSRLAGLPENEWTAEAAAMKARYAELLKEDAAWKEPEDVAALPVREQAAVWIHRMRDLAAEQWSQPGDCYVVGSMAGLGDDVVNPADKLVGLGWDALPAVIEHLDDMRPTRSLRYWRDFAPDSHVLLTYGDCCEQIFEAITGFSLYTAKSTSGTMSGDGESASAEAAARKWWERNGALGAEAYFLRQLQTDDAPTAAEKLLEMDAAKHLPGLIERMTSAEREPRNGMLRELAPHLGREHRGILVPFLDDDDLSVVTRAAWVLWETCDDAGGAKEVLKRLRGAANEERPESSFQYDSAVALLARVKSNEMVEGMIGLFEAKNRDLRYRALTSARGAGDPRVGDALVGQLHDTQPTGWSGRYAIRYCDLAAESLMAMAGYESTELSGSEAERDAQIAALREWWAQNRDAIEWKR